MTVLAAKAPEDVNPTPQGLPYNPAAERPPLDSTSLPDPGPLTERRWMNVQSPALAVVTAIAVVFALQWAAKFFIPLLFAVIIAYTLNPLVVGLERMKLPRPAGAGIVMLAVLCGSWYATISLTGQVQTILDQLPAAAGKLSGALRSLRKGQPNTIQKVQAAAREIEQATSQAADLHPAPAQRATPIVVAQPAFKLSDFLMAGSMGLFGVISQATMVLILVFFLLLSGDTFKHKLVRLTGPSLSDKKITVHILDDIHASIQHYMSTLLAANVLLALLTWAAFHWIGLDNAGGWAIAAGVLHVIPYVGPALIAVATGMAGFMQFESFWMALLVSGVSVAIATFVGVVVVTWMTCRISKMNAVAILIGLLFWGWLWGVWGLLLAIPIIGTVKVVSQRIEALQPLDELLSE